MNRLHLAMMFVVLIFAGLFIGSILGREKGAHVGAAAGVVLSGILLWNLAPRDYARQLRIIERQGAVLKNPEAFRKRFFQAVHMMAGFIIAAGVIAIVLILAVE